MKAIGLSRRDFIKTTSTVSLGITVLPDLYSTIKIDTKIEPGELNQSIFLNPGGDHRGVPFLFFNDDIDSNEAVRQVTEIRNAGWSKVLPRRYGGLMNPTYGKVWNDSVHEIIKACKKMNMKVFLQEADKNGWYSAAPTEIPGMKDQYRNKFIIKRKADEEPSKHEVLILDDGKYRYYQQTAYPKKGWENSFCFLDILDKDTVDSYLSALFSFLNDHFGSEFGKTIEAIWVAEPHITMGNPRTHDTLPWTPKLNDIFFVQWGYPLIENIPKLFEDIDDFQKVRYHYWRTLSDLIIHSYCKPMQEWCHKYSLKFTGHLMGEDTFVSQLQYSVNVMPQFEYMDIPGIDHLTLNLYWPTGDPFIYTPKMASSVANQMGRKDVLSEMYGCSDMGSSFEDRKNVFQWLAILGINFRNYHGAFYSMRGMRKRKYPVNLNYQQPYWSKNRLIADFAARLSYILKQGQFKADILVINSIESYYLDGRIDRKLSKKVDLIQKNLIELSHNLLKIHLGFDYGDETIISKYGTIKDDIFVVGEMSYKLVLLPSVKTLRKTTLKLLNSFIDEGGTVIATGDLPERIDGEPNAEIDAFNRRLLKVNNKPDALRAELNKLVAPEIYINTLNDASAENIWVHERKLDSGTLFYVTNISTESRNLMDIGSDLTVDAEIFIKGKGKLEYWNLENGEVESIPQIAEKDYLRTKLRFVPGGSYIIFLNNAVPQTNNPPKIEKTIAKIPVWEFTIKRQDPNSITLDFCRYHKGDNKWSGLFPVLGVQDILSNENYSGPVSLKFEFTSEIKPDHCAVVIEEADKYFVSVNNKEVSYNNLPYYRDKSFLPIEITDLVNPGNNIIQITRNFESADKNNIDNNNLSKFYGTELEQIYIIGDFAVKGERIGTDYFECKRDRFKPSFLLTGETGLTKGDLLSDGYCFFNGSLVLTSEVVIPEIKKMQKYYLDLEELETVLAEIKINDRIAGTIGWKPYSLDITDNISPGRNKIDITLTNSVRNLFGALHYVPTETSGGQWSQKSSPSIGDGPQWYKNRNSNKYWSDDYFFRRFGVGKVTVLHKVLE